MLPIDYFLFLQIAFFLTITPGTPRVVIMTYAINYGLKRSVITAVGDVSANTLQMILVTFGIGVLVSTYPNILNYLRWIGVLYLLFIAFDLVRYSKNLDFDKSVSTKSNLLLILIVSLIILDFSTLMIYGFTAQKITIWLKANPKTINTISACALIIIAIIIAVTNF